MEVINKDTHMLANYRTLIYAEIIKLTQKSIFSEYKIVLKIVCTLKGIV
jgi:hypothetical protein